jgi:2-phosphosulfolactate phosphatase
MSDLEIEFAWGGAGLTDLHDRCDVFVVLDVLCFTTSVDVAVARGAEVLPFPLGKYGADELARSGEAVLAQPRREAAGGPSLSPASLQRLAPGTRLVLPSPNGSALSTMVRDRTAFAASLRNATAVAAAVQGAGKRVAVIAAGEHWPGGSLRPAIEDLLGAGAIIARLQGRLTPEARAARAAYLELKHELAATLRASLSGRELIEAGFPDDVELAAEEDVSPAVPALQHGRYRNLATAPAVASAAESVILRDGGAADDAACGEVVGAAAATSSYAPQVPHAAALLGDRSPLAQEGRRRIVAEAGGRPVGFVEFAAADDRAEAGHVKYLFVHPNAQGQGIGDALLTAAETAIGGAVTLSVLSANDRGLRWYLKRGYRIAGGKLEENWQGGPAVWLSLRKDNG